MTVPSPGPTTQPGSTTYHERLLVPLRWWVVMALFVGSFWVALLVSTPPEVLWPTTAILVAACCGLLLGYGWVRLEVDGEAFTAGRARLEWTACGTAEALDPEATRRLRSVDADARAFLLLRPYVNTAVRVDVDDAGDPTPYWMISTRHPQKLATAINTARSVAD